MRTARRRDWLGTLAVALEAFWIAVLCWWDARSAPPEDREDVFWD